MSLSCVCKSKLSWGIVCLFILSTGSKTVLGQASFQGLGDLSGGSFESLALGVSFDGSVVVGRSRSALAFEAFRWTSGGGMVGLGDLPSGNFGSTALGVSSHGSVVVGRSGGEAFRWQDLNGNGLVDPNEKLDLHPEFGLGDLPGGVFFSEAHDVSSDGSVIAGRSESASGRQAFLWTSGGGMVGLGDLAGGAFFSEAHGVSSDGSVIVGESKSASGLIEAFRWTSGGGMVGLGDLPGGRISSQALGVSSDGSVAVGESKSASGPEAFRWTSEGGIVGLGDLPGSMFASVAFGTSSDGSVVVGYGRSVLGINEAFIWDQANGMRNLREVLINDHGLDLTGWRLRAANDISADGQTIVGEGINPDGRLEAWVATLAEIVEGLEKEITSGPDVDEDGKIDVVVEVGKSETTVYDFTITQTELGGQLIVDTVPAEWVVTQVAGNPIVNGFSGGPQSDGSGGTVEVFPAGQGAPGCPVVGDLNGDCIVDEEDFLLFVGQWLDPNCSGSGCADLTGGGGVNVADYVLLADNWNWNKSATKIEWRPAEVLQVYTTITFDLGSGSPPSYTEAGVTVTSLFPGHLHRSGTVLSNHSGCCSTPYGFDFGGMPFTVVSVDVFSFSGSANFVSSSGATVSVSGTGTIIFPAAGWTDITSFRWNQFSGSMAIDNLVLDLGATTPAPASSSLLVFAETRQSPGSKNSIFAPTSCGTLFLNEDGAEAFEVDENGDPLRDPNTGNKLPSLFLTDPLRLVAVEDLDGDGIVGDGSGDEDGDGVPDLTEAFGLGTDPCNPDTDGDGVSDGVDPDPLDPDVF